MVLSNRQLIAREKSLGKREAEISELERQAQAGTYQPPVNDKNFPSFLHWWVWHHDRDLSDDRAPIMKKLRLLFLGTGIVYLANVIGCLATLAPEAAEKVDSPATMIVLSLMLLVVLCPLAMEFVFFTLSKAMKRVKAAKYICGLAACFVYFVFIMFTIIEIQDGDSVDFIVTIAVWSGNGAVGFIALVFVLLAIAEAALLLVVVQVLPPERNARKADTGDM